jgi:hypothetical protein
VKENMIICIDITDATKSHLDSLLIEGGYSNYSEAISIAISNQRVLHQRIPKDGSLVLDEHVRSRTAATATQPLQPAMQPTGQGSKPEVPELFLLKTESNGSWFRPAPPPDDVFVPGQHVTLDRWIWGQYNKLLPVKATCRGILSLLSTTEADWQGIPLSKAATEISDKVIILGDYFRSLDATYELSRDDALSTAFPFSGSDREDKARLRYANQFVAGANKHGRLTGLLVDLKLINQVRGKTPKILLTQTGWEFASLHNPVLDGKYDGPPTARLSEDERNLLLQHISLTVPTEDAAYRAVLSAILDGAETPEALDIALKRFLPERTEKPFTDAFVSTQRSGAISRMSDLGLIEKVRSGVRVKYVITEAGKTYTHRFAGRKTA